VTQEAGQTRLRLDWNRQRLFVDEQEMHMTPMECRLIAALVQSQGRALSEDETVAVVWGISRPRKAQYLRKLVRQVRQKIECDPERPRHLVGAPGRGYRLKLG
jgi:two-component system KDP operon response regulator KdpE